MRELLLNEEIHSRMICDLVPEARRFLWIVTADIKDLHVARGRRSVPFLSILASARAQPATFGKTAPYLLKFGKFMSGGIIGERGMKTQPAHQ